LFKNYFCDLRKKGKRGISRKITFDFDEFSEIQGGNSKKQIS
jgi:hypothetical protein